MNNGARIVESIERRKVGRRTDKENATSVHHTPTQKRRKQKRDTNVEQPISKHEQEMAQAEEARREKEMLRSAKAQQISNKMPLNKDTLQQAIIWSEVLGAPVSRKRRNNRI